MPPPARPPPPSSTTQQGEVWSIDRLTSTSVDPAALRAKFHAKLFNAPAGGGAERTRSDSRTRADSLQPMSPTPATTAGNSAYQWVPPELSILQYFAAKVSDNESAQIGLSYDSDEALSEDGDDRHNGTTEPEDDDPLKPMTATTDEKTCVAVLL
jgi:hypothetical protein